MQENDGQDATPRFLWRRNGEDWLGVAEVCGQVHTSVVTRGEEDACSRWTVLLADGIVVAEDAPYEFPELALEDADEALAGMLACAADLPRITMSGMLAALEALGLQIDEPDQSVYLVYQDRRFARRFPIVLDRSLEPGVVFGAWLQEIDQATGVGLPGLARRAIAAGDR
jgi:hypothetical protein